MEAEATPAKKRPLRKLQQQSPGFYIYESERALIRKIRRLLLLCIVAGLTALLSILSHYTLKGV